MAVVLGAIGLVLYLRFDAELDRTVDQGLRSRAGDVVALVREGGLESAVAGSPLLEREESFVQVLGADGTVVDAGAGLRDRPLLTAAQLRDLRGGTLLFEREVPTGSGEQEPARLLATPVEAGGRPLVAVVGTLVDDNDEALRNLAALLALGGPIALLLASLAGYGVAAAALRPVEAMRRRAVDIGDAQPGRRLPVPPARDELRRLGETLNDMLARLEAAFARERTFVADASHELRTPLSVLKGEVELALREGRSEAELRDALRAVQEETDRLVRLAEDLLVIARSDEGRLPISTGPVKADELLRRVAGRYARRAGEAGRTIHVEADPELEVVADPLRLEQALGNLLDNALRHGGGRIELSAHQRDGSAELRVSDEGGGFAPGLLDTAFERFTKGDDSRAGEGAGLGLAIVAAIARAHGGEAGPGTGEHGGASVWIRLPAA